MLCKKCKKTGCRLKEIYKKEIADIQTEFFELADGKVIRCWFSQVK